LYQFPFSCSFEVDFANFFRSIVPRKLVLWRASDEIGFCKNQKKKKRHGTALQV
jgi:hypothetical protein